MKLNLEDHNGSVDFSIGATRPELYGIAVALIAAFSWICRHFG